MKRTLLLVILIVVLLLMAVPASPNSASRLRVKVPFAFYVDKQLLPAGDYIVEMRPMSVFAATGTSVLFRGKDGTIVTRVFTIPGSGIRSMDGDYLRFHRYGSRYFLVNVTCLEHEANLMTTQLEKELGVQAMGRQDTTLVAQR